MLDYTNMGGGDVDLNIYISYSKLNCSKKMISLKRLCHGRHVHFFFFFQYCLLGVLSFYGTQRYMKNTASYKQMYVNASPKPYIQHQERMS